MDDPRQEALREHADGREADAAAVFAIIDNGSGPDPDYDGGTMTDEDAYTRLSELPLAVSIQRYLRVDLSMGGPAEWIEAKIDDTGGIGSATFHYADWGTHDERPIEQDSALWRLAEHYLEGMGE